jgi:hypothetical protein
MRQRTLVATGLSVLTLSCGEVASPPEESTDPSFATVRSVTVSPSSATIAVGRTVQLTARAKPSKNVTFTWSSSNSNVASVSPSGLVNGKGAGSATIRATSGGVSGQAAITVTGNTPPPSGTTVSFVGAGDISECGSNDDEATAKLLDALPAATVFTLGDNAYDDGTSSQFTNCYHPTWGRHKARTRPSPGNHDYHTSGASGYYAYYGSNAGPSGRGYYSYNLGAWHLISLNSNVSMSAGSPQEQWLRQDLAATTNQCVLAYWHHPRFSSSSNHGNDSRSAAIWTALYQAGAELVLGAHDHTYERFAPQTPSQVSNPNGIRQFVVGTGGRSHYGLGTRQPNSEVSNGTTYGVLKLTLSSGGYSWEFIPVAGASFRDSGSGQCH